MSACKIITGSPVYKLIHLGILRIFCKNLMLIILIKARVRFMLSLISNFWGEPQTNLTSRAVSFGTGSCFSLNESLMWLHNTTSDIIMTFFIKRSKLGLDCWQRKGAKAWEELECLPGRRRWSHREQTAISTQLKTPYTSQ